MYVLPETRRNDDNCRLSPCLEVLQKPNYVTMETKKALFKFGENKSQIQVALYRTLQKKSFLKAIMERKEYIPTACFGADQGS